jgi:hypothetical protein
VAAARHEDAQRQGGHGDGHGAEHRWPWRARLRQRLAAPCEEERRTTAKKPGWSTRVEGATGVMGKRGGVELGPPAMEAMASALAFPRSRARNIAEIARESARSEWGARLPHQGGRGVTGARVGKVGA